MKSDNVIKQKKVLTESGFYLDYMILDTPCFPARYYVGFVNRMKDEYVPADNATFRFHRSYDDALIAFVYEK